jgi:hypothetical protein
MSLQSTPLTPVQVHGPPIIAAIYGLFRNLEIHDEHNQLFGRLTHDVLEAVAGFESAVGEIFTLQMYGQELVVCSRLLRLDDAAFERAGKLGELLVRAGIGGFRISGSTSREDLVRFCHDLTTSLKGAASALERGAYGEIRFASLEEDPSTALATRPEQLALWLFGTLLDLTWELANARAQDKRPSLLPLKRVLQRISEVARTHGAVFQLLPAIRNYSTRLEDPHRAVCESLSSMSFGISLGLRRRELLVNALAAVLCRISSGDGDVVKDLLSYRGLGELGPQVLLAAHDVVNPSPEAGMAGQVLSLVRCHEDAMVPGESSMAPSESVAAILRSPPMGVASRLAQMFTNWQGREPLGSPVQLDGGQIAMVLGPSRTRPNHIRVATLESGSLLGAEIDLGATDTPQVQGHPNPGRIRLDLTQVRTG